MLFIILLTKCNCNYSKKKAFVSLIKKNIILKELKVDSARESICIYNNLAAI